MPSNYKFFSDTPAADAPTSTNMMEGEWVKKQDIMYQALVVYDCRVWKSNFAKEGENKETATFQVRFEKDVDTFPEDDVPFMLVSSDSSRMVNMAHALLKAKDAEPTDENPDPSPFPFVAALIEDTSATWTRDHFGQFPIILADPTPENLERPVPAPKQTAPSTRRGPVSQPRSTTSTHR